MTAQIRDARPSDVPEIVAMIRELAEYEREPDAAEATEEQIHDALFGGTTTPSGHPAAHCLVVDDDGALAGIALWFLNFSTWRGTHGVYLEDLFVRPAYRGSGLGRGLLVALARICVERGYGRLEWWVLNWNQPAIDFYRAQGAVAMDEWTVFRVTGDTLVDLAR
ncbi:MAG: GNAT family N-acetyltransferase [Candidatus Nanopelagicales bacterium]